MVEPHKLPSLVLGGDDPRADIPESIFQAALKTYLEGRRLDMKDLANELGLARSTLYRKIPNRDHLLGAVVWFLMQHAFDVALKASGKHVGAKRLIVGCSTFMHFLHEQVLFKKWLDAEPETALRVLTSKGGPIQAAVVRVIEHLLVQEEQRGNLILTMDRHMLAFLIVRIGESFLYADVIADNEPNLDLAVDLIGRLLAAESVPADRGVSPLAATVGV